MKHIERTQSAQPPVRKIGLARANSKLGYCSRTRAEALVRALENGVRTRGAEALRAKQAGLLRSGEKNSWLEIVLNEGKN